MNQGALIARTADALREASDEGITPTELAAKVGTRWIGRIITSMQRNGFTIGEQDDRFYLVSEPGVERASDTEDSPPPAGSYRCPVAGSLSPEPLVLFPSGSSHYREAA
jgi:hypothetical protein